MPNKKFTDAMSDAAKASVAAELDQPTPQGAQAQANEPTKSKDSLKSKIFRHAALQLAGFADAKTTRDAINEGRAHEANPLMKKAMATDTSAYISKALINLGLGLLYDKGAKKHGSVGPNISAGVAAGIQGAAALHNSKVGKNKD